MSKKKKFESIKDLASYVKSCGTLVLWFPLYLFFITKEWLSEKLDYQVWWLKYMFRVLTDRREFEDYIYIRRVARWMKRDYRKRLYQESWRYKMKVKYLKWWYNKKS